VLTRIAHLLSPGEEPVIRLGEAGDAARFGIGQEAFANEPVEPLELTAALGRIRTGMDQANTSTAQLRPTTAVAEGAPLSTYNRFGHAAPLNGSLCTAWPARVF
jgi:hypothetical protein